MTDAARNAAVLIAREAGWREPEAGSGGECRFSLDGGLDFSLVSPDGRTVFLHADLGPAPDPETPEGDGMLRALGGYAAGAMTARRSVLSVSGGRLQLHLAFPAQAPAASMLDNARIFLNDLEWWQAQVRRAAAPQTTPSFFFDGGFNPNFLSL